MPFKSKKQQYAANRNRAKFRISGMLGTAASLISDYDKLPGKILSIKEQIDLIEIRQKLALIINNWSPTL